MNLSAINKVTKGNTRTNGISDFAELELSKVYANPLQPRKDFSEELLQELAEDIKTNGLLQPIIVVKKENGLYMIVGGERRYRAVSAYTQLSTIKAHIIQANEAKILELALIENIQREDLTDFEIAVHIGKLWSSSNYATKTELAKAIGKSQSYISKAFGCLRLDESIIKDIQEHNSDIGLSVLEEVSRVKDKTMQKEVYALIKNKEITRDEIKDFKELQAWDADKMKEVKQRKIKLSPAKQCIKYSADSYKNIIERMLKDGELDENKIYKITIEEI